MKIPVILKGDTPQAVQLRIAEGLDYTQTSLVVEYRGVTKVFYGLVAGETKLLQYTSDETASFPLGTDIVHTRLVGRDGTVRTIRSDVRIKVTDCPEEVYDAEIVIGGGGVGVSDLGASDSLGKVKEAVNGILSYLRGGVAAIVAVCLAAFGEVEPKFAALNDIPGNVNVLTNAYEYISGVMTAAGTVTPQTVTNIVTDLGQQFGKVASVNGQTGAVELSATDVGALPLTGGTLSSNDSDVLVISDYYGFQGIAIGKDVIRHDWTNTKFDLEQGQIVLESNGSANGMIEVIGHSGPASITKDGKEVATEDQLLVRLDLVENAGAYTVQLGGVVQTFAQIKELAETRNAVIVHGKGTYRVTYIGANEMMWDCTGTVQGEVQTGMIHLFAAGDVVQLVPAKTLADKDNVTDIAGAVSGLAETVTEVSRGYKTVSGTSYVELNQSVQRVNVNGGSVTITAPASIADHARDWVVYIVNASDSEDCSVTLPAGCVGDEGLTKSAAKAVITVFYFSEFPGGLFAVGKRELHTL